VPLCGGQHKFQPFRHGPSPTSCTDHEDRSPRPEPSIEDAHPVRRLLRPRRAVPLPHQESGTLPQSQPTAPSRPDQHDHVDFSRRGPVQSHVIKLGVHKTRPPPPDPTRLRPPRRRPAGSRYPPSHPGTRPSTADASERQPTRPGDHHDPARLPIHQSPVITETSRLRQLPSKVIIAMSPHATIPARPRMVVQSSTNFTVVVACSAPPGPSQIPVGATSGAFQGLIGPTRSTAHDHV
jgi:hypothetical protein